VASVTPRLCLLVAAVLAASTVAAFAQHRGRVAIAFSPDGTHFLSAGEDKVILWDAVRRTSLRVFAIPTSGVIAFLPDGRTVVSNDYQNLKIWDVVSGQVVRTIKVGVNVTSIAIAADGRTLLLGFVFRYPQLWDFVSGQPIRSFEAPGRGASWSVALSPDGRQALSTDQDGTASLWDTTTGQRVRTFEGLRAIAFSPNGQTALVGRTLYDLASGAAVRQFGDSSSTSVFSRDGRWVLIGHFKDFKSWEVATGRLVQSFPSQRRYIHSLALAPDNGLAVTGSDQGHVALWNVANGRLIASFDNAETANTRFLGVLFFAIVALILGAMTISSWRNHRIQRQTKDWPTTRGRVLSSDVEETGQWTYGLAALTSFVALFTGSGAADGWSRYLTRIHYRYSVAENTYDGERIHFAQKKFWRRDDAEEAIKPYPMGTEVTVHYLPQDPGVAVLSTAEPMRRQLYIFFGMAAFATAMVVICQYAF